MEPAGASPGSGARPAGPGLATVAELKDLDKPRWVRVGVGVGGSEEWAGLCMD